MQDKKSFLLYKDQLSVLDKLSNEQAGILFKAIADYQIKGLEPKLEQLLDVIFMLLKNSFERDHEKYLERCEKNKTSARMRWDIKNANACDRMQTHIKNADSDKDSDKEKDSDIENDKDRPRLEVDHDISLDDYIIYGGQLNKFKDLFNLKTKKLKKITSLPKERKQNIIFRLKENNDFEYWEEIFKKADKVKVNNWRPSFDWIIKDDLNHVKIDEEQLCNEDQKKSEEIPESELKYNWD